MKGAFTVNLDRIEDERGFFARSFCEKEFSAQGLVSRFVQCNVSYNRLAGTLRGMHFQVEPHGEAKLVRCTMGVVYDVIVDIRPDSPTYLVSFGIELSAANRNALLIPHGFAHGFQALRDDTEVLYKMSEFFHPASARGIRWDDPVLALRWPMDNPILSDKDRGYPLLARDRR